MKKRIIGIMASLSLFSLVACSNATTQKNVVTEISEEVEVTKINNSYMDVYNSVEKGCCAVLNKTDSSLGSGSAVIYKYEDGYYYAVTNAHVIKTDGDIAMYFNNNRYVDAEKVGYDETNDVAVVRFTLDSESDIDIKVIDFMNYETTDLVSIGQSLIAIGCPLSINNYNNAATGIVANVTDAKITTDASLNPGNSGGGVFNMAGRLIGLNYKKEVWTTSNGSTIPVEGRSYIIPLSIVKYCVSQIEASKSNITRPLIGITVSTVSRFTAFSEAQKAYLEYLPTGVDYGFIITNFTDDIPYGANSGLHLYDCILKVNNIEVTSSETIGNELHKITPNDTITLTVYRKSENKNLDIVIKFIEE